jgi:integrase
MLCVLVFVRVLVVNVVLLPYGLPEKRTIPMAKTLITRLSAVAPHAPQLHVAANPTGSSSPRDALSAIAGSPEEAHGFARLHDLSTGHRHYQSLGSTDDVLDADEQTILSFDGAQERAREFFKDKARELAVGVPNGVYTVDDALTDYLRHYEGKKGAEAAEWTRVSIDAHIRPVLGRIPVRKLTARRITDWHHALAAKSPRRAAASASDAERVRKRRASANRVLTALLAALNLAYHDHLVPNDDGWRAVKKFEKVDVARVRFLTKNEAVRLVRTCVDKDFRDLVHAALLTGCRYGELASVRVEDFQATPASLHVIGKGDKSRFVSLNAEGKRFFSAMIAGKSRRDLIFAQTGDRPWGQGDQHYRIREACRDAKIDPAISFHILRHTYASMLAMRGVPMNVIARQLGHADSRLTEKYYAHLAPNYVAETIRKNLPRLGV